MEYKHKNIAAQAKISADSFVDKFYPKNVAKHQHDNWNENLWISDDNSIEHFILFEYKNQQDEISYVTMKHIEGYALLAYEVWGLRDETWDCLAEIIGNRDTFTNHKVKAGKYEAIKIKINNTGYIDLRARLQEVGIWTVQ